MYVEDERQHVVCVAFIRIISRDALSPITPSVHKLPGTAVREVRGDTRAQSLGVYVGHVVLNSLNFQRGLMKLFRAPLQHY